LVFFVWNQYLTEDEVQLGATILQEENFASQQAQLQALIRSGVLVPLLVEWEEL
jgi:hypothetical protein